MKKTIALQIIFILCSNCLFAQDEDAVFVIRDINYSINGKTRESALERILELKTGERFSGQAALDAYIKEKEQDLYNIRALEPDQNKVTYTPGEPEEDGAIPVYLRVSVADSANFIIVPDPKYDSNSGFTLSLKARTFNFLGTLAPQKFDLKWGSDDRDRSYLGFLLDITIPFRALGYNWTFSSFNQFNYYLTGEPFYNTNILGIAVEIPASFTAFTFGFEQGIVVHEENTKKTLLFETDAGEYHDWFLFSRLFADWKIPTPLRAGKFGAVVYTPGVYGSVKYQSGGSVGDYRRGPVLGIRQDIGFGRIDWVENFRHGLRVSVFNGNEYNFFRENWINDIGILGEAYFRFSKLFGISARLMYTKWINDFYEYAGDVIRGYKDDELDAKERLSLNIDFPFRLIRFVPSQWTGNSKYRYFDFEQHWSLFIDMIMLDDFFGSYSFKPEDIITGIGLEIITFSLNWRSFYLRMSAGWNMREAFRIGALPSGIHREIYIGIGHYY